MERPKGVTVLAYIYFVVAFSALVTLIPSQTFQPLQWPRLLALSVGYLHHRGHSGYRTLKNEKLVPLVSHHNERDAAALRSTRSCCRPQLCCRDPRRGAHIVLRLGNLVFDSTARKDGVPERLIACKSTNYFALPPFCIHKCR